MGYRHELIERLEHELSELCRKPDMSIHDLELMHTLTDTIKNIEKICILRDQQGDEAEDGGQRERRKGHEREYSYRPMPTVRRRRMDTEPDWDTGMSRAESPVQMDGVRGHDGKVVQAGGTFWMNEPEGQGVRPMDENAATAWVKKMRNADGSTGEHFTRAQAEQQRQAICPQCGTWAYYAAINMMYSDYCEVAKKMGLDRPDFYAHMAKAFLEDGDAGKNKIEKYKRYIAGD